MQLDAVIAGDDYQRALGRQHRTGDYAQAIAERAAGRQPPELGRDHRPADREQARDILEPAVDAGTSVLDIVAAGRKRADLNLGAGVETVVGQLLKHQPRQLRFGDPGFLLQTFDCPKRRPVLSLEFQNLRSVQAFFEIGTHGRVFAHEVNISQRRFASAF